MRVVFPRASNRINKGPMARLLTENLLSDRQRPQAMQLSRPRFSNPIYDGADPYVVRHDDVYYSCNTGAGGRIEVWKSDSLVEKGQCTVVWAPRRGSWNRGEVWAPGLHYIRGYWVIYYAASDRKDANHRMRGLK